MIIEDRNTSIAYLGWLSVFPGAFLMVSMLNLFEF